MSYIWPLFRYKDRWKELNSTDFVYRTMNINDYSKGYNDEEGFIETPENLSYSEGETFQILPENIENVKRISQICVDNDISLVLYKAPTSQWTQAHTSAVQALATEINVPYIDYMLLIDELNFDGAKDFGSNGHLNNYGAEKLSKHLGNFIAKNYAVEDRRQDKNENSWDKSLSYKKRIEKNNSIQKCEEFDQYLQLINNDQYVVAIAISKECSDNRLPFTGGRVINDEKVYSLDNRKKYYLEMGTDNLSIYLDQGNNARIAWNSRVISCVEEGVNILVYDKITRKLVDEAGFPINTDTGCIADIREHY